MTGTEPVEFSCTYRFSINWPSFLQLIWRGGKWQAVFPPKGLRKGEDRGNSRNSGRTKMSEGRTIIPHISSTGLVLVYYFPTFWLIWVLIRNSRLSPPVGHRWGPPLWLSSVWMKLMMSSPPQTNKCPLKKWPFSKEISSSNRQFSGDILIFQVCNLVLDLWSCQLTHGLKPELQNHWINAYGVSISFAYLDRK